MKTTFLGQGFESASVNAAGNYLIKFLSQTGFHSFTGISAFASEAGVFGMSSYIQSAKQNFKHLNLIVGIDQEGTSKEALLEILNLQINSFIFYQYESPIFHPKLYLFEGDKEIKLIIGSSNLTGRGLFTNIESSLLIEFDVTDHDGIILLAELKNYYKSLFDFSDPNLFKITNAIITDFTAKGIVPDETTRKKIYNRKNTGNINSGTTTGVTNTTIPKRTTAKIPSSFPKKSKPVLTAAQNIQQPPVTSPQAGAQPAIAKSVTPIPVKTLVWKKTKLSQSDAQHVPYGTRATGNLKLAQAKFRVNNVIIDQTTYFRNKVFNNLNWVKSKAGNNSYEEVFCQFSVTISGVLIGIHTLKLSHDPVRIAGQGNTPTWLHWGTLMPFLQQTDLTGKMLNLYQAGATFFIDIS